jgi:hypothetical protein
MIEHVVLMKVKPSAAADDVAALGEAVRALTGIDGVESVAWGANSSADRRAQGYTHGFVARMRDRAALDGYLPHAIHQVVVAHVQGLTDDVLVFDVAT